MAVSIKATMNTNSKDSVSAELSLTTETVITLYVVSKTGSHKNSRMTLEYSPDGIAWIADAHSTNGIGILTSVVTAAKVRACVCEAEGSAAIGEIHILAR